MQLKALALCIAVSTMFVAHAHAEDGVPPADTDKIKDTSGEQIYKSVCQGCHMPDGKGAAGAGRYPSLANNGNLEYPEYAIFVITYGQKAMPAMGDILTDQQIADVVTYIRTHFGNTYTDEVTADQIVPPWP
ncbi:c-type cytochrome [Nitratireductor rhodophyticola]|uniref:c-type cytochrome n=1 Tax=Nitratireductor rhodophyticola TaxID=2854036 RepID=UPI00300892D3